jgi:hypothetical protein
MEAIMDTTENSTTQDIPARFAYLVETCDGGPTFKAELKELASDVKSALTNDAKKCPQDLIEEIKDRLRWAIGGIMTAEVDESVENHVVEALAGVEDHLRKAKKLSEKLWRRMPRPNKPRDLTNCNEREDEKRDLVRRLIPLSHDDFNEVMFCGMFISSADDQTEGLRLLEKYPLSYVHHFLSVQKDQAKASEAAAAVPATD